jgi:DNA-binding PadR family transcriptional regulator
LALVIEKPSYGYEVWQRFDQRFSGLLEVGSSRIYQVVNGLLAEGMIEEIPGDARRSTRQPKPRYRATELGESTHRQWLAEDLHGDAQRVELRRRLLAISAHDAHTMLDVVDRYEQACLDEMAELQTSVPRPGVAAMRETLLAEERRLVLEARMKWILYARRQLQAAMAGDADDGDRR